MQKYESSTTSTFEDPRVAPMATPGKQTLTEMLSRQGAGAGYAQAGAAPASAGGAARPTLRVGSSGPAVVELQQKLQIAADGQFGPQTRAAVVAFQQTHGLGADGVVGPMTWGALDGKAAAPAPAATPAGGPDAASPTPAPASAGGDKQPGSAVAGNEHAPPEVAQAAPAAAGGVRGAIVAAARSKIGSVFSDVAGDADETGDRTRQGWQTLTEIFEVGMPAVSKNVIKYIKYGKNNGKPGSSPNGLVSWCAVFATWAVITGGGKCGTWGTADRCSAMNKLTRDPKPGDVGYFDANSHHCIIASVDGDQIETIDGNSYDGNSGGNGAITSRMRSRHDFQGFFKQVDD